MKTSLRFSLVFILLLVFGNARSNARAAALGSDATLKSIVLSTATSLIFTTGPSDYNYTTSVSPGTPKLTVKPTTNDPTATVTVNGVAVPSGTQSAPITLNGIVTTTINMVVTAQDGVTIHTYSIVVYESGSNNAFLSALSLSTGNALVAAATGPGAFNYTASVTVGTNSLAVIPTTADPSATVQVNGVAVTSGSASGPIALNPANNATTTITVTVTAQDGVTTQTYSILVTEAGSNNALLSTLTVSTNTALVPTTGTSNFNYTTSVKPTTTSIQVTPTSADGTAKITVNGIAVASGALSNPITTLPATISIVVTAQDGVTQETYSITVSLNATAGAVLGAVSTSANSIVPTPPTPATGAWSINVDPTLTSLTITPVVNAASTGATITVNGATTANGTASASIPLNTNPTIIPIVVTSQDGLTTTSYSLTVNKIGSNNANDGFSLSTNTSLVLVSQTSTNIVYKTSVPASVTSLTLTPTAVDPNYKSITVNGVAVTSGSPSGLITLSSPTTSTITMIVTAQDGISKLTTTISVLTTGSNNATLSGIALTPTPASTYSFVLTSQTPTTNNYSTSLNNGTTSVTITPTAADPTATISIAVNNGAAVLISSGVASSPIALAAVGSTTLVTLTTVSPDGTVTKTTNITISRNGSSNANSSFSLSTNTGVTAATGQYNVNYTSTVSPHTTSLTVKVTASDPNATITVNGLATVSGIASYPITLSNGNTTIVIKVTAPDGVTTKTTGIIITRTGTFYTWTGASGTSWSTPGNWNPVKAPTASDVVSLGETAYTGSQPTITGLTSVGEIYFGSVTPTTLTIPVGASNRLTIGTNLTVDSGAVATIKSAGTTAYVDITSTGSVNFGGTGSQLIITSPVVLTLLSTAASSASVGQMTTTSIVGNVTVQRYISGGSSIYRGYRLLSSPVYQGAANGNNVYSINYIQASSLVTGTSATGGFNKVGNPSLYLFREDVAANNNSFTGGNYWGISAINNVPNYNYYMNGGATVYNIPVANGFFFFFRGDNVNNLASKYTAGTVAESVTLSTTGTLNAGPITVHDWFNPASANLSYTTTVANGTSIGLQLVGNPYASSIDWDTYNTTPNSNTGIDAVNVGTSIYILDPVSKNYGVYIANSPFGGTNNATHVIPSGQGFFVQAFGAGASLTFNENAKTTAQVTGSNLLMGIPVANAVGQYLHLKLNKDSLPADEIFISFKDNAQSKFVLGEDAVQKPGFGVASLASLSSDGVPLSVNTLSLSGQSESINLNVNASADGAYQLTIPEIKSIPTIYSIWLMDAYKKDSVDVRQNPTYNFTINTSDAASYGSNRFSLVIRQNTVLSLRLLNFTAAKATNGAQIVWKTANEQNYTNFTVERSTDNGKTFEELGGFLSSAGGTYSYLDKNPLVALDQYRLKIEDLNGAISYSKVVPLLYSTLSDNISKAGISVYPNPTSGMVNLTINQTGGSASSLSALQSLSSAPVLVNNQTESQQSYDIKIINITGNVVKTAISSQPIWQDNLTSLLPGTYIIQVLNSSDKSLVGKSTFIKL